VQKEKKNQNKTKDQSCALSLVSQLFFKANLSEKVSWKNIFKLKNIKKNVSYSGRSSEI